MLEHLEGRLGEGGQGAVLAGLAFVAAQEIRFPEAELAAARRRAMLVLAAGGDPHRSLDPESRAVRSLAEDLGAPERRAELAAALERVRGRAVGLEGVGAAIDLLRADADLAWRWVACALLAEEFADEGGA